MRRLLAILCATMCLAACEKGEANKQRTLDELLAHIEASGFRLGERQEKWYSMIGAVDGFAIEVNGDKIEVYQFDTGITSGADAMKKLESEGIMGQRIYVNGNLALTSNPKHADWDAILEAFNTF